MNIVEFLEARISEDEAAANDATGARWVVLPGVNASLVNIDAAQIRDEKWKYGRFGHIATTSHDAAYAEHIARHDPSRVLAECAAKRAIIDFHTSWPVLVQGPPDFSPRGMLGTTSEMAFSVSQRMAWLTEQEYRARFGAEPPTAPMICALAAVYADHPDYQEEWRHA